jgi:putative two-component system response regulator
MSVEKLISNKKKENIIKNIVRKKLKIQIFLERLKDTTIIYRLIFTYSVASKMIDRPSGLSQSAQAISLVMNYSEDTPAKILIVDDHPLSRMTAVDLLLLDNYEVLEADSGLFEIDYILEQKPDLVLLDVMMPRMDGFEICKLLKQDERTCHIPVIFMTVADEREYRRQGMEVGGDDFLTKPLDRFELLTRVKSLINQKRLNEGLDQTEQVLFSIAKAVESRSSDSGSSCARISALAQGFGEYLQLSQEAIDNLVFAAHLHDIGTVAIPDAVLLKKGELTPEETELIRQHVLIGEKICQPLRNRRGVLPIVRHHHERWDGSGYPDGLAGNEIPQLAQVFQILDIYDALTSERPHKKAYTPAQALEIITEETAKGWRNPHIVEEFTAFIVDIFCALWSLD